MSYIINTIKHHYIYRKESCKKSQNIKIGNFEKVINKIGISAKNSINIDEDWIVAINNPINTHFGVYTKIVKPGVTPKSILV